MSVCWRCSIEFDSTPYLEGAPCLDCQEVMGEENWLIAKKLPTDARSVYLRQEQVRELHAKEMLDSEIGARMGISKSLVAQYRRKLGLPKIIREGMYMWKDEEAHMEHARNMIEMRRAKEQKEGRKYERNHNPK